MIARALVVLCLVALVCPVHAQTSPPPGVLHVPTKAESAPPPTKPASAAPVTAVQQVAPLKSPNSKPAHPAPAKKKPTPVVSPARPSHAQKPPTAKPGAAPAPAPPPPVPAPAPQADKPTEPPKGSVTGLPLPRFASLRSDDVDMRAGPGTRYPVDWVYHRRGLPVEIEREFQVWRLVRDEDGVRGWVHEAMLIGRRDFVVTGGERTLRSSAADTASPVAMLKPGVIGRIRDCAPDKTWCEVQVGDYRGWLKRDDLWGTYPQEAVN